MVVTVLVDSISVHDPAAARHLSNPLFSVGTLVFITCLYTTETVNYGQTLPLQVPHLYIA